MQDFWCLVSIILNNFTMFHIHTAISFSVTPNLWHMGRSLLIDLSNLADFAIMRNLKYKNDTYGKAWTCLCQINRPHLSNRERCRRERKTGSVLVKFLEILAGHTAAVKAKSRHYCIAKTIDVVTRTGVASKQITKKSR